MKKIFTLLVLTCLYSAALIAQRVCGTNEHQLMLENENPTIIQRRTDIENFTHEFETHYSEGDRALVTIPVVVHVVWNSATENISDAQILSQIAVLNADFRKLNADANNIPSAFASLASDPNIEFCLASVDPSGNATSGINRVQTSSTSFGTNDQVKSTTSGGTNAWDATKYLNLWVCDISGSILGYAQFPGGSASTDGVVIDYMYFGTNGTATAPFNKGRTATHEVGHWLNLYHIWGDDGTGCNGSDQVSDTPNQADENYGCPSFPAVSCSNGPNGDLFMNYMDYSDDACMYMFSNGQATRMQALFAAGGARASLLTSNGCGNATPTCTVPAGQTTSVISNTGATASWNAASGAANYNFRYRAIGSATWNTSNTTSTTTSINGLSTCTAYEWQVQTVCSTSGSSAFGNSNNFTTTGCAAVYCTSSGGTADEFINTVAVGSINNNSGNNGGYANFTSLSTTLNKGTAYSITLTPGFTATAYTEVFRVWIDLNGDQDFADTGELLYAPAGSNTAVTGSITVPTTAITGVTRMRVSMQYNAAPSNCGTFTYGEVEDYSVNLAVGAITCGTPSSLATGSITQSSASLSWGLVSGASSYILRYKTATATTWNTVSGAVTPTTLSGLLAATTYNFQVAAVCSGITGSYSAIASFTTTSSTGCSDIYESNNTLATAKPITVGASIQAVIGTSTDKDYFSFANSSSAKNIRIDLSNLPGDYDVRLYNPSGTQVGMSQNGGTTSELIKYNNGPVGTYKVYVYGYNGAFSASACYALLASTSATAFREMEETTTLVTQNTASLAVINAYPNPTNGKLNVQFNATNDGLINIRLMDITGREVYNSSMSAIVGINSADMDLTNLANGYYTLVMGDGKQQTTVRIEKQ